MCGIVGFINKNQSQVSLETLQKMTRALTHRGPDDEGYFVKDQIGLGHRRLSIIDIGGGHQPMTSIGPSTKALEGLPANTSMTGRWTIVFNGEIYNFKKLQDQLVKQGVQFKTNSDTEVLLELYIREKEKCLNKLNGMFAFAIWDEQEKSLFVARDRMGKKPFYYWNDANVFAFASECKAFYQHPQFSKEIDQRALIAYLQYEYVPAPFSIFKSVKKLPAAHYLIFKNGEISINRYWDIPLGLAPLAESTPEVLFSYLDRAVASRLVSDVPLGVFLSGGIDSSTIVALMARHRSGKDIKTFSIGFSESSYDESEYARKVAIHFGTDHHEQILKPQGLLDIIPEVTSFLDEPFADYSIFPTYLLSKFTRQHVTVALGGDGGDELFAGYPTFYAENAANLFCKLPRFAQKLFFKVSEKLKASNKDMSLDFKARQFLRGVNYSTLKRHQAWLGSFLSYEQQELFVRDGETAQILSNPIEEPLNLIDETLQNCRALNPFDRLLYFYQKFYLCDDILFKTDRASMAASLEVRAPFLDVDVVEYAARLPYHLKSQDKGKFILKKVAEKILPHEIVHRKKKGFGIPLAAWLKNELKEKMMETLAPEKIKKEGVFNYDFIQKMIVEHLSGIKNHRKPLFTLLMFQWWKEKNI